MHLAQRNALSAKLLWGKFFALTVKAVYSKRFAIISDEMDRALQCFMSSSDQKVLQRKNLNAPK